MPPTTPGYGQGLTRARRPTGGGLAWPQANPGTTTWSGGSPHPDASAYASKFTGKYEHRVVEGGIGHNLPQEAPQPFAEAIIDADRY
jgi:hypothetical protein